MNINMRIFYTKTGRAKYISHLDVNRCMQRALKRSGLPCWYTEGFNPHLYVTFPLPISLGHQSLCESMDIKIDESISPQEIREKLSATLPEGFCITNVAAPVMKSDRIAFAEYEILLASDSDTPSVIAEHFSEFMQRDTIFVEKKTKKGFLELDIKPSILIRSIEPCDAYVRLRARFAASIMQTINPQLLLNVFFAAYPDIFAKEITRLALTDETGVNFC